MSIDEYRYGKGNVMAEKTEGIKLVMAFVERGQGTAVARLFAEYRVVCNFQSVGQGTASSDLLDALGFGTSERDILISMGCDSNVNRLMYQLQENLYRDLDAKGIVFDMPLSGITNLAAGKLFEKRLTPEENGNGGGIMKQSGNDSLIIVVVNQGNTDDVMDTARSAGARGGTVVRSRWAGGHEDTMQFYGISLQAEKEIIFIVAARESRNAIMEAINETHGLNTAAAALTCSLEIENIAKL